MIRLGVEPKTHSLEGCCSIQLSYRTGPFAFRRPGTAGEIQLDVKSGCKGNDFFRICNILNFKNTIRALIYIAAACASEWRMIRFHCYSANLS